MQHTITLDRPIKFGGEEVHELTLDTDRITVGALAEVSIRIDASGAFELPLKALPSLLAAAAAIPVSSAKQIAVTDLFKLQGILSGFFPAQTSGAGE